MAYTYSVSLTVNGIERNFQPGSLNLEKIGLGRSILRFTINSTLVGSAAPRAIKRQRVVLTINDITEFDGIVWTITETRIFEKTGILQTVECVDFGKLSEKVLINEPHAGSTLEEALAHAVRNLFPHTITPGSMAEPGPDVPTMAWEWLTIRQTLELLATISGWVPSWDGDQVTFIEPGTTDAPFDIDDIEPNWLRISKSSTLENYWNHIWGRYGPRGQLLRTETITANGTDRRFYLKDFLALINGQVTPDTFITVTRSGVATQETTDADPIAGTAQWHFDQAAGYDNALVQDAAGTTLSMGDTITIIYTANMPGAVFALDVAEYSTYGPHETKIDIPNIIDKTEAQAWVDAKLQELVGEQERVSVATNRQGLNPFQALVINVDDHEIDGDYLILKTQARHVSKTSDEHLFEWTIECVLGNQYRANWEQFFRPNASPTGTGGAVIYTPFHGCPSTHPLIFTSDWNSTSKIDTWTDLQGEDSMQVAPVGAGGSFAAQRISDSEPIVFNFFELADFLEGCIEFRFKSDGLGTGTQLLGLRQVGIFGSDTLQLSLVRRQDFVDLTSFESLDLRIYGPGLGASGTLIYTADNFYSQTFLDWFRIEFKAASHLGGGVFGTDGYVRFYRNGILVHDSSALNWHAAAGAPDAGFGQLQMRLQGILDSVRVRGTILIIPSASVSPSASASSSVSRSASRSASSSVSRSPSASASPSSSVSRSASASNSPSSSVSRSASASVSPSSSPSSSSSPSVSASPSPTESSSVSASVSPSASAGFPSILGQATNRDLSGNSTHVVNIPSNVQTGDLLVVIACSDANNTFSISSGTGWTIVDQTASGSTCKGAVLRKIATGSDALTLGTSTLSLVTSIALRVTNFDSGITPLSLTAAAVTGANSNPPSHTPPGGAKNYLWLAARCGAFFTASAAPTNYEDLRTAISVGLAAGVSFAERELNAASEDPGAFTCSDSDAVVYTIAIEPAP